MKTTFRNVQSFKIAVTCLGKLHTLRNGLKCVVEKGLGLKAQGKLKKRGECRAKKFSGIHFSHLLFTEYFSLEEL